MTKNSHVPIWISIYILSFLAFWPTLQAGFIWDDVDAIFLSPTACGMEGLKKIWFQVGATPQYYPATYTSLWLDCAIFGLSSFWLHMVNIVFHSFGAIILFEVLVALNVPGAAVAAIVFAIHPVQTETIAWTHERKNILAFLFMISSLWLFLKYLQKSRSRLYYFLSLGLFVLALLSKTVACSLPVVILSLIWWKEKKLTLKDVLPTLPYFVLGFAAGLTTIYLEKVHVGASGQDFNLGIADRFLIAGQALWFYVGKIIWPHPLIFIYPRWNIVSQDPVQWLFPLGWTLLLVVLWQKSKGGFAAAAIFSLVLFPALGFIDVYPMIYSFVADHFQYMACAAVIAALVSLGTRIPIAQVRRPAAALIVFALVFLSMKQSMLYTDRESLWLHTIENNPEGWMAYNNLGAEYAKANNFDLAQENFEKSLKINPKNVSGLINLTRIYLHNKAFEAAALHISKAVQLRPDLIVVHQLQGETFLALGEKQKADEAFHQAQKIMTGTSN